jgi:ubiquinone/menaquinone biosynthesis C-methylase UbiE
MSVEEIQAAYDEQAELFHRFERVERLLTDRHRRRLFGGLDGRVLDVACGTGTNFPHFDPTVDLTGIDLSQAMLEKARERVDDLGLDGRLRQMDAQALEFEDDQFDTVVSALSTCTFPRPREALQEIQRVCAPDGQILLLEHGRSDIGPLARFQEWRSEAHYQKAGCQWTQEPLDLVESAGLEIERSRSALFGMLTTIVARPG